MVDRKVVRDWDAAKPRAAGRCIAPGCGNGPDDWCKPTCTSEDPLWPPPLISIVALIERLDRAKGTLKELAAVVGGDEGEKKRLQGKIEGVELARSYAEEYAR